MTEQQIKDRIAAIAKDVFPGYGCEELRAALRRKITALVKKVRT